MKQKFLKLKNILFQTNQVFFFFFTSLYLILLGLETYQRGFVSYSFNLNIFLIPIFVTTLVLAFAKGSGDEKRI